MLGTVECLQKTEKRRSVLQTSKMPVLCEHVHRAINLRRTILFRVHYAPPDVDYLGMCLLSGYNLFRPYFYG